EAVADVVDAQLALVLLAVVALDDLLAVAGAGQVGARGGSLAGAALGHGGLDLGRLLGVDVRVAGELRLAVAAAEADDQALIGGGDVGLGRNVGLDGTLRVDGLSGLRGRRGRQHQAQERHRNDAPHADPLQRYLRYACRGPRVFYFLSLTWGAVPDFAQTLMVDLLAQSGLCFTSYWESPFSPHTSHR